MNVIPLNTARLRSELSEVLDALKKVDAEIWQPLEIIDTDHARLKFGVLEFCNEGHKHLGIDIDVNIPVVALIAQAVIGIPNCRIDLVPRYRGLEGEEAFAHYARDILLELLPASKAGFFVMSAPGKGGKND